jgi:imidazolonepropionase-like amidohydrolase
MTGCRDHKSRATAAGRIAIVLMVSAAQTFAADETITAIKGGDLYTITSGVIHNGTILIKDGTIWRIGRDLEIPKDANVVDAAGKVVMPGLVAATTMSMPAAGSRSNKIADSLDPFNYTVTLALASGVTSIYAGGRGPSGRDPI